MAKKTKVTTWVTRDALRSLRDVAAAHKLAVRKEGGVTRAALFGSATRGEADEEYTPRTKTRRDEAAKTPVGGTATQDGEFQRW